MAKYKVAARITIEGPGKMTPAGRRRIAKWLERHADDLRKLGSQYTNGRFVGRYFYA